jgi:hypothetical protein
MRIDDSNKSTKMLISQMKTGDVFFWSERYWMVLDKSVLLDSLGDEDTGRTHPVVDLKNGILCMFFDDAVQPLPNATLSV